jgi:hypothetical protein
MALIVDSNKREFLIDRQTLLKRATARDCERRKEIDSLTF